MSSEARLATAFTACVRATYIRTLLIQVTLRLVSVSDRHTRRSQVTAHITISIHCAVDHSSTLAHLDSPCFSIDHPCIRLVRSHNHDSGILVMGLYRDMQYRPCHRQKPCQLLINSSEETIQPNPPRFCIKAFALVGIVTVAKSDSIARCYPVSIGLAHGPFAFTRSHPPLFLPSSAQSPPSSAHPCSQHPIPNHDSKIVGAWSSIQCTKICHPSFLPIGLYFRPSSHT